MGFLRQCYRGGGYNLLRVIANPQINSDTTHLVSGDSVKATAQAKRADGSATNGIDVTGQATVAWYAAEDAKAPAADWTLLSDMSGAEATVSASAAGKYLSCRHERKLDGRARLGQQGHQGWFAHLGCCSEAQR